VPHLLDAKFSRRLELRLWDKAPRDIEQVRCPDAARDDPLIDPRRRDDQDVSVQPVSN